MKTVLIAHNYSEVSFAAMSYHLAHHFADCGYRVVFISHYPYFLEQQIIKNGKITICSWPTTNRPTSMKDFFWYTKMYIKYKPDIVIGHFVGSKISILVSKLMSLGKVKTFEYYHTLTDQLLTDLIKITLKQKLLFFRKRMFYKLFCTSIICPSELAKNDLKSFYGISRGLVLVNPMIDRLKTKKFLSEASINISYLGRLDPSKGVIDLIKAFETYKMKVTNSKIILNIAGTGSQHAQINKMIKNSSDIRYLGALPYDAIDDYLSESHYTIIPSKFDNLPTVGLESMMNQIPLLISNTTGLTHYLTDGKECFKFDATVDSIVQLFGRVENNFDSHQQMSKDARALFLEKFSIDTYCNKFSRIIS